MGKGILDVGRNSGEVRGYEKPFSASASAHEFGSRGEGEADPFLASRLASGAIPQPLW